MAHLTFSSKADTLKQLRNHIKSARVLPLYVFDAKEFGKNKNTILAEIETSFKEKFVVVRSSAANEDSINFSNAGHFVSLLKVNKQKRKELESSIKKVIDSFNKNIEGNQIFIQPFLQNVRIAGVALTSDLDTLAPYYVINYDESGSTDSITSGTSNNNRTYIYYKDSIIECPDENLRMVVTTLKELEKLYASPFLDVEFAINKNGELFIFQVRPIAKSNKEDLSGIDFKESLFKIFEKIKKLSTAHPNLLGEHAIYGVMPDWNPAEIIGVKPKALAVSLYKEIITDKIWAYQRDNYGYRNLRSHPLMIMYLGVPYIDVRVDFNSFIPKDLEENVATKLVDFYLNKLVSKPTLHDKIEFEIIHSCYYFGLPEKLKELEGSGFSEEETKKILQSLLIITNNVINPLFGLYKKDIQQIEILKDKHDKIINSQLSLIDKIYWLIEYIKRYGTLPFAGIARSAFIATQLLRSLVDMKIMSSKEFDDFNASLNTIAKTLNVDLVKVQKGKLSRESFLNEYGHLRPGTYNIMSKKYEDEFENYFSGNSKLKGSKKKYNFNNQQLDQIDDLIAKSGLIIHSSQLIDFFRNSIEDREYAKFVFTRSLSKVLSLIEELGLKNKVKKKDLEHLDIKTISNLYSCLDFRSVNEILMNDIEKNQASYEVTKAVKLPSLITKPEDIYGFFLNVEEPNFITLKSIQSEIVNEEFIFDVNLKGKIVFIKSADPGYDFLFTKDIAGLVTQFGGANSHMAVRCAELSIPAVIGAGEKNFKNWANTEILEIDCINKQVRIIS